MMNERATPKRKPLLVYLDPKTRRGLDQLQAQTVAPLTELVRRALNRYIKEEKK